MSSIERVTVVSGVVLGVVLFGVARTSKVASVLQWMGMEPWCWPVRGGLKTFLVVVLSCVGVMFSVLMPVLVVLVVLFAAFEYAMGFRMNGTENPRRLRFMSFCETRAMEILFFHGAIAVIQGNKLGVCAFVTLFLLSWLVGDRCA